MSLWRTPGLVDVHAHLGIDSSGAADSISVREAALAELRSGVQLIREPGSPLIADCEDGYPSPRVIRSGRHIAREKRYLPGLAVEVNESLSLSTAVQQQAARSDSWVKIVGDWIDRSKGADSDLDPLWERHQLIDAVQAAHEAGARVAVHAFGSTVVDDLLEAHVDSIEHGTGMNHDQITEAKKLGIAVTPTLAQVELFPNFAAQAGRKYPVYAETMTRLHQGWRRWFEDLLDAGVWILPGTDAGGYQPHGSIAAELGRWVDAGMAPATAVEFATDRAWEFLRQTPDVDSFVEYDSDPREDIRALSKPSRVVWRGDSLRLDPFPL